MSKTFDFTNGDIKVDNLEDGSGEFSVQQVGCRALGSNSVAIGDNTDF